MKVRFSKKNGKLPIDHWVVSDSRERWPGREPATVKYSAEAYTAEYSPFDPRLWLCELPFVSAVVTVTVTMLPWAVATNHPLPAVLAVLAMVCVPVAVTVDADEDGNLVPRDRRRKVAEVDRCGRKAEAAWRNNPEATMEALRVLAKNPEDTTGEAKALAEGIIGRLAKRQRALDEEARAAELAEAEALAELQATYPVPAVTDRRDELRLERLAQELDLQGK